MFDLKWSSISRTETPGAERKEKEEWVWIEGYKGTDNNMCCRDYQFELGKRFDMPEDAEIVECKSGFHLCEKLKNVFHYYDIEDGNRFFKVRALVQKNPPLTPERQMYEAFVALGASEYDKRVAKSIEFVSEVTTEELLEVWDRPKWMSKQPTVRLFEHIRKVGIKTYAKELEARKQRKRVKKLEDLGYSKAFATFIVLHNGGSLYGDAVRVAAIPEISVDMRVAYILADIDD